MTHIYETCSGAAPAAPRLRRHPLAALLACALAATACGDILEVDDPTTARPGSIDNEAAVPTTLAAAAGAFQLAYSGAPGGGSFIDSQVTASGTLADELHIAESFPTRIDVDQRETRFENATMLALYARLHTARRLAEFSAAMHDRFDGTRGTTGHAHALNLAGFAYVLFAENYCSGVPFSTIREDGGIEYGPPLSTTQMLERALALFDEAAVTAAAAGSSDQLDLARTGRGRTLLALDRPDAAAAAVAAVPTAFVFRVFHSLASGRQNNGIWGGNQNRRGISVSDREGNGLPYRSDADPRVPQRRGTGTQANGFDNTTPLFLQLKYPAQASSVVLASGVEARLIEAEARLRTGGDWLETLNGLRSNPPATVFPPAEYPGIDQLAALAEPGSAEARADLLFRERAYWLWLTSHRVGDLRRLMRQHGRNAAQAGWPTGSYFRGGVYGDHVAMPVPFDELNNPLFREQFPEGCNASTP
jgi:starch-binding outer membrane protein, SusD/RagB family